MIGTGTISRIVDEFGKIRAGMKRLKALESGLRPVFKIETSEQLDSGIIGDRIIANTIPWWVTIKQDNPDISGYLKAISSKVIDKFRSTIGDIAGINVDKPVIGIMVDEGITNPYRFVVNVIFQNLIVPTPRGNKWLGEDLLMLGFPLRISFGFLDVKGKFIQHPYAGASKKCVPDFTGIVAALTQEIFATGDSTGGDRFQVTATGFEYLFGNTICDSFSFSAGDRLSSILARLLYYWATGESYSSGTSTKLIPRWPIPILTAMGVCTEKGNLRRSIKQIENHIKFIDVSKSIKVRFGGEVPGLVRDDIETFLEVLIALSSHEYTNTHIFFDNYGKLTVQGIEVSSLKISTSLPSQTPGNRVRVHDAVVGSNVLHLYLNASMDQMSNQIDTFAINTGSSAEEPIIKRVTLNRLPTLDAPDLLPRAYLSKAPALGVYSSNDQVMKYYGPNSAFGSGRPIYLYGRDISSTESDWHKDYLETLAERNKYWGMRGGVYMLANPKIHVGDVLRIMDIRKRTGIGTLSTSGMINLGKDVREAIKKQIAGFFNKKTVEHLKKREMKLGLGAIEDIYYVWKVKHYIGQRMFTTKVFLIKEPKSLIELSPIYQRHIFARRGWKLEGGLRG